MGHSRILVFTPELEYARGFVVPPAWLINSIVFDASGNLVLASYGREQERGILVLDREGSLLRAAGPVMENVDLAGFEDSLLGGSLSAFDDGFAHARKSPVEMTLLDATLTPLTICTGDRSWTTEPADVVQRTDRGAGLRWNCYAHAVSVVGLAGGDFLHTILDPITDSSKLQLVTPGCDLVQTINSPVVVIPEERHGDLLYATRTSDYPEVVVYRLVWRR